MSAKSQKLLSYPEAEGHADSGPGWPRGVGWGRFLLGYVRLMGILAIIPLALNLGGGLPMVGTHNVRSPFEDVEDMKRW